MAKRQYLKGNALNDKFLSGFNNYTGLNVIIRNNDIILLELDGHKYYVYLKCISHKGNPYPLNDQRAQLPQRPIFDTIKDSDIDFLFLGYDMDNDVFVCWDPLKVRQRLNVKTYVSFYSFKDIQNSVMSGKILPAELSNGDKFVLFKREDVLFFFNMIKIHFPHLQVSTQNPTENLKPDIVEHPSSKSQKIEIVGFLADVNNDQSVKLLIDSLIADDKKRMEIICNCMNSFAKFYYKMKLTDWKRVIYSYLDANNSIIS